MNTGLNKRNIISGYGLKTPKNVTIGFQQEAFLNYADKDTGKVSNTAAVKRIINFLTANQAEFFLSFFRIDCQNIVYY